ncbi:MAG: prepilin-type N-terminal cleavage/methylation domain-containing protein [Polyangiaceae bacterium]|nr:prepilin-type N-terminal cleavage/methylation domain-containing protein [Polyangiaceae bacterium]
MMRAHDRRRTACRGFTLPELMVSLVAGLIVTMAVVALARTATRTFYEQIRTTSAEESLRIAAQRLSNDLSRASFMSTGNIRLDPMIARMANASDPAANSGSRYPGLNNLASLRLYPNGDPAMATPLPLSGTNNLNPQAIDITGNFTSNDQYLGTIGLPIAGCGVQAMTLNGDDPTVLRMLLQPDGITPATNQAAIIQSIFVPVNTTNSVAAANFAARVTDSSGRTHFVVVCAAGMNGAAAFVEFAAPTAGNIADAVLSAADTGQIGGVQGFEQLQIAPVQTVRWSIQRVQNMRLDPPQDANAKYDLFRQYIDAVTGQPVGNPELIAEYVVDMAFALTVDQGQPPANPQLMGFDFPDIVNNPAWASANVATSLPNMPGPQRIRSVRFRLAARAALPDREADMPGPATGFLYRYCIDENAGSAGACTRFARVRTLASEVALINQARMIY